MKYLTVTPAYGREYKALTAAKEDWHNRKDFIVQPEGRYINKDDASHLLGPHTIHLRYNQLRKTGILAVVNNT